MTGADLMLFGAIVVVLGLSLFGLGTMMEVRAARSVGDVVHVDGAQ